MSFSFGGRGLSDRVEWGLWLMVSTGSKWWWSSLPSSSWGCVVLVDMSLFVFDLLFLFYWCLSPCPWGLWLLPVLLDMSLRSIHTWVVSRTRFRAPLLDC